MPAAYVCGDYMTTLTDESGSPIDSSTFTFIENVGTMDLAINSAVEPASLLYTMHAVTSLVNYPKATFPGVTEVTNIF